jgi:hypothetical protein
MPDKQTNLTQETLQHFLVDMVIVQVIYENDGKDGILQLFISPDGTYERASIVTIVARDMAQGFIERLYVDISGPDGRESPNDTVHRLRGNELLAGLAGRSNLEISRGTVTVRDAEEGEIEADIIIDEIPGLEPGKYTWTITERPDR